MPIDPAQDSERLSESADPEMYEAVTLIGADHEMSDIDFAFGAQAEVVTADG